MKILQTLGKHGQVDEGVFAYRRTVDGVEVTLLRQPGEPFLLTSGEWQSILTGISSASNSSFRLSLHPNSSADPPRQALYDIISSVVPNSSGGWAWDDSKKACICAILEHEGSVDLYGGPLGQGYSAIICLSKNCG